MTFDLTIVPESQKRFSQAFNRLAVAKRLHPDEIDTAMKRVYFETLADVAIAHVETAAHEIERDTSPFPKAGEWRERALLVRDHAEEAKWATVLPARFSDGPDCPDCEDTGWFRPRGARGDSPWAYRAKTQELRAEIIEWVAVCPCRPVNQTYQRKREYDRQRAKGRDAASTQEQRASRGRSDFSRIA